METQNERSIGLEEVRGSTMGAVNGSVRLMETVPRESGFWKTSVVVKSPLKKTSNSAEAFEAYDSRSGDLGLN